MRKPEANSSDNTSTPGQETKKKAVSGPVIESRPVSSGEGAGPAKTEAKPQVESRLVGSGKGAEAAAPKPSAAAAQPGGARVESSFIPPVAAAKPEAAKPETARSEAAKNVAPKPDAAKPEPKPERVETRVVEVRKAGFMPTVLGGVVAAGLGAAAAWWAIPHLPPAWQPALPETAPTEAEIAAAREAGTEAAKAEIEAQGDVFASRASDAGADAARQALADASLPGGDAAALKAQTDKLAALERTVSELAARPATQTVVSGENGAQLQQLVDDVNARLTAQQQRIDELSSRPAADPAAAERMQDFAAQAQALQGQIAAAAAEAEKRIAAAQSQAAALQESAEAANRRAQAATAAAALQAAIETGGARDQALADLRAAGVEPPVVLAGEVPTLEQLRGDFPAAARDGLAAALKATPGNGGALDSIGNFLRVQTGARSVEPREGDDPDAVLSRADAAVKAGDIKGALAEIGGLPQPGQDAMSDWTAKAGVWVEANAALAALAAGSL
ncbi:COG4223 family protein [Paracoccus simplex]|uniref:COG4223 family protein n=1 Tax=Paracoccus simplex TaxID=2086346 RepID=A0ABV7RTY2_9RHOB